MLLNPPKRTPLRPTPASVDVRRSLLRQTHFLSCATLGAPTAVASSGLHPDPADWRAERSLPESTMYLLYCHTHSVQQPDATLPGTFASPPRECPLPTTSEASSCTIERACARTQNTSCSHAMGYATRPSYTRLKACQLHAVHSCIWPLLPSRKGN